MSLRLKLALYVALCALLTLTAASTFLYWSLKSGLEKVGNDLLEEKFGTFLKAQSADPSDPGELQEQFHYLPSEGAFFHIYARIMDGKGKILIESPGMQGPLRPSSFNPDQKPSRWRSPSGQAYLLMAGL